MSSLRMAVIGAGNHSSLHHGSALKAYAAAHPGEIDLAAVCDRDLGKARAYAERFGFCRAYADYRAMLDGERVDGLIAVTPAALTAEIAADLLPRGIPLVIEKPTGESAADALRLLRIARRHAAPHMVSFNRRFNPSVIRAREWLAAQTPRRSPRLVVGRMLRHGRQERQFVTETGIHLIDAVLSFMGTPVRAVTQRTALDQPDRYFYSTLLHFEAGRSAALAIAPQVGAEEESLEIMGQGYVIQIDAYHCAIRICDAGREVLSWQAPRDAESVLTSGALDETAAFLSCVRNRAGYSPDLGESLVTMVTAEAVAAGGTAPIVIPS